MSDQTVDQKVIKTIRGHGRGWVFTPRHLASLGSRNAVASALKRYKQAGVITALARGLYYYPRTDPELGQLDASNDQIARALAGRDAIRLQATGAYAANLLGLSDQVPTTVVYLTDGRSREVAVGNRRIILKRTSPRAMATSGRTSGLVIQALRHLGQDQVTEETVSRIRERLSHAERRQMEQDIPYAPAWIGEIMRALSAAESAG
jgi:predicted transcriptional regulator of viral defense system